MGADVVDLGMVDNTEKAQFAAKEFKQADVEIIFLFVSTYALSSTVCLLFKGKSSIVILNLQPVAQLDYKSFNALGDRGVMTGKWLEHCQSCSLPELASVFNRAGVEYQIVSGYLQEDYVWQEINDWVDAARVGLAMRTNRVGF